MNAYRSAWEGGIRKKLNPIVEGQKTGQRTGSSESTAQSSTQGLMVKNIQTQENLSDRTTNSQGTRSETTITSESEQETLSTSIPPSPATVCCTRQAIIPRRNLYKENGGCRQAPSAIHSLPQRQTHHFILQTRGLGAPGSLAVDL